MEHIIRNKWAQANGRPYAKAQILDHHIHPEGLDVARFRFTAKGSETPDPTVGHIVSLLRGSGKLTLPDENGRSLHLEAGVHLYLPPGKAHRLTAEAGTELLQVSATSAGQARGDQLLLRDETFVSAAAAGKQSFRWILTPQYLSRRIFLHNDKILLSKSGNPVSWFRTTMFDVAGLPVNDEGDPVFKMSYNSRTEFNVCYDVKGRARVRMADHPYQDAGQAWGPWQTIDGDTTYHLNEAAAGPEIECTADGRCLRNKHEVHIVDGYVTLFCLFDPAPSGVERHQPGAYSDYEPLSNLIGTHLFEAHQKEIATWDRMVDTLSLAKAEDRLEEYTNTDLWQLYLHGREAQDTIEAELLDTLAGDGQGRDQVVAPWIRNTVLN